MTDIGAFSRLLIRDYLALGLAAALLGSIVGYEALAISFGAGCIWVGINTALLAWLLGAMLRLQGRSRTFIFLLSCAKIPAAYLLLYWLFTRDYLEPMGLAAGLITLPVVIVVRGLSARPRVEDPSSPRP